MSRTALVAPARVGPTAMVAQTPVNLEPQAPDVLHQRGGEGLGPELPVRPRRAV